MIRNLKALGLAFAAMLALGAVAASAASAQQGELTTESGQDVTLIGKDVLIGPNAFTAFGGRIECPGSAFTGHQVDTTEPHQLVPAGATEITLTPHYNQLECEEANNEFSATVEMNSCDYDFEIGETGGISVSFQLRAAVTCDTEGDQIHIGLWGNEHHESGRVCTIEVGEQSLGTAELTDVGNGYLEVWGSFGSIHVERHGLCVLDGKGTTDTRGEFDTYLFIEAEGSNGEPVKISVSTTF